MPKRAADRISIEQLAGRLAAGARAAGCDLAGFGDALTPEAAREVREHLLAMAHELLALQRRLGGLREAYLRGQRKRLARTVDSRPKIHIGGGSFVLDGWVNAEIPPAELGMNLLWGLPFRDRSARFVFASHVLEHLFYPGEALSFLVDARRVLDERGVLRLVVPDIEKYVAAYVKRDRAFFRGRRQHWGKLPREHTMLSEVLLYAGASAQTDDFFGHKFGYDFDTLKRLLREAGFRRVVRSDYMKSRFPELRVDWASHAAAARFRGQTYSLFVEATR
jgi:predicted SAM-dependent methyltransferase